MKTVVYSLFYLVTILYTQLLRGVVASCVDVEIICTSGVFPTEITWEIKQDDTVLISGGGGETNGITLSTNGVGQNYIAYCWHSVPGYSAFGSYNGNSSTDGPFVYTGFKPAFLLLKMYSGGTDDSWTILDNVRDEFNSVQNNLFANSTAKANDISAHSVDFLSNGFKFRGDGQGVNNSSRAYIYVAFAEQPYEFATGR